MSNQSLGLHRTVPLHRTCVCVGVIMKPSEHSDVNLLFITIQTISIE